MTKKSNMENITNHIPKEILQSLQQFVPTPGPSQEGRQEFRTPTKISKIVVLAFSDNHKKDEIFHVWQENHIQNPHWTLQAIDEATAERFGISARTVKRVRYKMAQLAQQKT